MEDKVQLSPEVTTTGLLDEIYIQVDTILDFPR